MRLGVFFLLCITTIGAAGPIQAGPTEKAFLASHDRLQDALEVLVHLPAGKALVQKALKRWNYVYPRELLNVLRWGPASKTDAVLTRHFNPATGEEERERQITIYVREKQPLKDIVLDIAHELVHATAPPGWDPYDPNLTA